jgi:hypothetical protein
MALALQRDVSADQLLESLRAGLADNNSQAELGAIKPQVNEFATIFKRWAKPAGQMIVIDYTPTMARRSRSTDPSEHDRQRGLQQGAVQHLARRQAGAESQEGPARDGWSARLPVRPRPCRLLARLRIPPPCVTGEQRLAVTDDFLRMPVAPGTRADREPATTSCMHEALLAEPRAAVPAPAIDAVADADVRDNFRIWLRFRDRLLAADTLEAAYARLFQGAGVDVAPLFVHQLTQILCRHVLGAAADPLEARVAECLFRAQRISGLGARGHGGGRRNRRALRDRWRLRRHRRPLQSSARRCAPSTWFLSRDNATRTGPATSATTRRSA